MKHKMYFHVVAVFGFTITGFIIGNSQAQNGFFHFSNELNPLHGLSVLASLVGIFYVSLILDKNKDSTRSKRDIVLRCLDQFSKKLDDLEIIVNSNDSIPYHDVVSAVKKIGMQHKQFNRIFELSKIKIDSKLTSYEEHHRELRRLVSDPPKGRNGSKKDGLEIKANIVRYGENRTEEIVDLIGIVKGLLIEEQLLLLS